MIKDGLIEAQVSFIHKDSIELELEIKAVTTHEFEFRRLVIMSQCLRMLTIIRRTRIVFDI